VRDVKDLTLVVMTRHRAEVGRSKPQCQLVSRPISVDNVTQALRKLDVIFPMEDNVRGGFAAATMVRLAKSNSSWMGTSLTPVERQSVTTPF